MITEDAKGRRSRRGGGFIVPPPLRDLRPFASSVINQRVGAFAFQWMTGQILEATGSNYSIIFVICGLGYVTALGIFHLIVPRLEPADMQR